MEHDYTKVKQQLKSDLHEEFSHELGMNQSLDPKDKGDMTAREAGNITKSLVELGEERLVKNLKREKVK